MDCNGEDSAGCLTHFEENPLKHRLKTLTRTLLILGEAWGCYAMRNLKGC